MAKARPWVVTKHGPIEKLDDNLWAVEGGVPGAPFQRRMTIVKRSDGTLLFYNAMPLDERALEEVKAWGKPSFLVVPHDQHMIDARPFAEKLEVEVYAPKACAEKARAKAPLAGTLDDLPPDPALAIEPVAGVNNGEAAIVVTSGGGRKSVLVSDALMNNRPQSIGFLPRMIGFAGPLKIVPIFRMFFLKDKKALKAQIGAWADLAGLARVVPCHGDVVSDPAAGLRAAAATL